MNRIFVFLTVVLCLTFSVFGQENSTEGALEFDWTKNHHVNHGIFWKPGIQPNSFFWEAWVKPYNNAQYVISDGYGGAHALLFGFGGGVNNLALTGNIFDNSTSTFTSFGTDETVPVNQWCHIAVGWDGKVITTYLNGVLSGVVPYAGQRSTPFGVGTGVLFIGGSDHNNFNGKIARVRGFEGNIPLETLLSSFIPEKYFRTTFMKPNGDIITASFLADYSTRSKVYPDLSVGFNGINHAGVLSKGADTGIFGSKPDSQTNLPTWTSDPLEPNVYVPTSTTTPPGMVIFDSFNRENSVWTGLGLGEAQGFNGTTRVKRRWLGTHVAQWGIFGEKAYNGGNAIIPVYVETGISNMDVRVSRVYGAFSPGETGIVYRYQDDGNFGSVFSFQGQIYLVERVNGVSVLTGIGITPPALWSTLRVIANGNSIRVFCNEIEVMTKTTSNLLNATKAGIVGSAGTGDRFDNFTVLPPPAS